MLRVGRLKFHMRPSLRNGIKKLSRCLQSQGLFSLHTLTVACNGIPVKIPNRKDQSEAILSIFFLRGCHEILKVVLQVRHPLERLVSAYRFTFERGSSLGDEGGLASTILSTYPMLASAKVGDWPPPSFQPTPCWPQLR